MPEIIIPMITPFERGEMDKETLRNFISYAAENGFDGLFPGGSTGGFASLSQEQHKKLLEEVIEESTGLNLFAGICRNNLEETLELGKYAIDLGYHNIVSINPFYHKFSERVTEHFFETLLDKLDAELFIYNNPSLSGSWLSPAMVSRLKDSYSNLAGMKDSGNDFSVFKEYISIKGLKVYQGKDAMLAESLKVGAYGGVCSTANFCLNTLLIAKGKMDVNEASIKTKALVQAVAKYEVPAIHNYLFRKLIMHETSPENYINSPFLDLDPLPDIGEFRELCLLP